MIKINTVSIKTPKSFSVLTMDIDGTSNRNALGELLRDRIAVKAKLVCAWGTLTPAEMSQLLTAVEDVFFEVEYPDPKTGGLITKTMYVGNRTSPMYSNINGNPVWEGLTMNFIEQ